MWQGRDANRKLQRSIKAGKQRERVPMLVEQLRQVLTNWQMEHRLPFTYDGWDYKVSLCVGTSYMRHARSWTFDVACKHYVRSTPGSNMLGDLHAQSLLSLTML